MFCKQNIFWWFIQLKNGLWPKVTFMLFTKVYQKKLKPLNYGFCFLFTMFLRLICYFLCMSKSWFIKNSFQFTIKIQINAQSRNTNVNWKTGATFDPKNNRLLYRNILKKVPFLAKIKYIQKQYIHIFIKKHVLRFE